MKTIFPIGYRKIIAGMAVGAMMITGAVTYQTAFAADNAPAMHQSRSGGMHHGQQVNKEDLAKRMAKDFGLKEADVLTALNDGGNVRDIHQAAILAKASGKNFNEVLALKKDKNWAEVEKSLGVTREQKKEAMIKLMTASLSSSSSLTESQIQKLLSDGYRPHDIAYAGQLAAKSGKDVQSVLDMKKINNTWRDVAKSLGIDIKDIEVMVPSVGGMPGGHRGDGYGGRHGHGHGDDFSQRPDNSGEQQ